MKVQNFQDTLSSLTQVQSKSDSSQSGKRDSSQDQNRQKDDREIKEVDDEQVVQAIDDFTSSKSMIARGITAQKMGEGPGLRVVLKDGSGAVIRQMTGEEFVELRSSVTQGKSGQIIDRKL